MVGLSLVGFEPQGAKYGPSYSHGQTELDGLHPLDQDLAHQAGLLPEDAVGQVVGLPVPEIRTSELCFI